MSAIFARYGRWTWDGTRTGSAGQQTIAEGRVFLAFSALVLRTEVENRRLAAGMLKKLTVAEFLAEMGRIRAIRLPDRSRFLREVSKRQREWLAAVGLPPPNV